MFYILSRAKHTLLKYIPVLVPVLVLYFVPEILTQVQQKYIEVQKWHKTHVLRLVFQISSEESFFRSDSTRLYFKNLIFTHYLPITKPFLLTSLLTPGTSAVTRLLITYFYLTWKKISYSLLTHNLEVSLFFYSLLLSLLGQK